MGPFSNSSPVCCWEWETWRQNNCRQKQWCVLKQVWVLLKKLYEGENANSSLNQTNNSQHIDARRSTIFLSRCQYDGLLTKRMNEITLFELCTLNVCLFELCYLAQSKKKINKNSCHCQFSWQTTTVRNCCAHVFPSSPDLSGTYSTKTNSYQSVSTL